MPVTIERTFSVDRLLAQQADVKLRQYGWSMEGAFTRMLVSFLAMPDGPEQAFSVSSLTHVRRQPGGLNGRIRISPDFDDESDEVVEMFEKSSV